MTFGNKSINDLANDQKMQLPVCNKSIIISLSNVLIEFFLVPFVKKHTDNFITSRRLNVNKRAVINEFF